ncbi:MAG: helix-turn-helix domain-containing protein [Patescibacteria group bacterium]|nr:helix-turn-helix domain-containing protein [Patescibacteria group bacterium]
MDLQSAIQNLGLTEKEAKIYLALLQSGQSTAYQIAKKSGLKKPTTYVILDGLIERGAVRKILKTKAMQYKATDPVELFVTARSRVQQAESVLPELRALAKSDNKVVQATYYEGVSGIREMYNFLMAEMKGKEYVGFYAHEKDTPKELANYWNDLNEELVRNKIKRRAVTPIDETTKRYIESRAIPRELADIKGLPKNVYDSNISIEIFNQYTQIISHRYEQGILIQNPDIANTLRMVFEIVWKAAGKSSEA